jgi:hypothetical protein
MRHGVSSVILAHAGMHCWRVAMVPGVRQDGGCRGEGLFHRTFKL